MKIVFDVSLTELGNAVEVLLGELKKLGLEIRKDQAYSIVSALLSAFRKKGQDGEK